MPDLKYRNLAAAVWMKSSVRATRALLRFLDRDDFYESGLLKAWCVTISRVKVTRMTRSPAVDVVRCEGKIKPS